MDGDDERRLEAQVSDGETMTNRTRIGILGAGAVSHLYLPNLVGSGVVEIAGIADIDAASAAKVAEQYGALRVMTPDELYADPTIEIVMNLTAIRAHVATTTAALLAGKHVYSEKPLAMTVAESQALLDLANERGLSLTCAPDTLLGTGFQAAYADFQRGAIGKPLFASATMMRFAMHDPSFYTAESFAFFDMAPYYVTALIWLLGPASRVTAAARMWPAGGRLEDDPAGSPIGFSSTIEFVSGATAQLTMGWGIDPMMEVTSFDLFGTTGVLGVPNPNNFGDPAFTRVYDPAFRERSWVEVDGSRQPADWDTSLRGLGVAEMALALREGRRPRLHADVAVHVVDIIAGVVRAATSGERVELATTCEAPPALGPDELAGLLA